MPWLIVGFAIVSWTAADIVWTCGVRGRSERPLSEHRRWPLADLVSGHPGRARAARAVALARRTSEPVAGRADRRRCDDRARRRPRLRAGHPRRQRRGPQPRGRDRPGLSGRRPAPARHDHGDLRAHELEPGARLDRARPGPRPQRSGGRHLPRPDRRRHLAGLRVGQRALAGVVAAGRAGRLAADQARQRPQGPQPAGGHRPRRLRPWGRGPADLRPLLQAQRADGHPCRCDAAAGAGAHSARVRREPAGARPQPPGGAHGPADRPEQPAQPDGGPRRPAAQGDARAARGPGPVRSRRVQGVQRRFRPPGRRRPADAAGRAPRRRRPGARGRLSARRRRVLRGAAPRCGRSRRAGGRLRRGAGRARRGLRGDDLARGRGGAGGGHGGHRGAEDRRPTHVCPQG